MDMYTKLVTNLTSLQQLNEQIINMVDLHIQSINQDYPQGQEDDLLEDIESILPPEGHLDLKTIKNVSMIREDQLQIGLKLVKLAHLDYHIYQSSLFDQMRVFVRDIDDIQDTFESDFKTGILTDTLGKRLLVLIFVYTLINVLSFFLIYGCSYGFLQLKSVEMEWMFHVDTFIDGFISGCFLSNVYSTLIPRIQYESFQSMWSSNRVKILGAIFFQIGYLMCMFIDIVHTF